MGRSGTIAILVDAPELIIIVTAYREAPRIAASLDAEQLIWAPVLSAAEAIVDPQAIAAGAVVQTPQRDGTSINAPGSPVRFPGVSDNPRGPAPLEGEHTRAVLAELGYGADEIEAMFASGAAA